MNLIELNAVDLTVSAILVLLLAGLSMLMQLGLARTLLIAAVRTTVQLLLIGMVLKALFTDLHPVWIGVMASVMLIVAGREVMMRQQRRYKGLWGYGMGTLSMFISTFAVTILALVVIIRVEPWYMPQYSIPLLGMMLGNTMSGIALGLDRLTQTAWQQRGAIEARLMLGHNWQEAIKDIRRESTRTGMIPMINAMAAAGIVSLPGMMTGQILAGAPPMQAVNYQILIMFMVVAGTGVGAIAAVTLAARRLFDERERLRLDRIRS